MPYFGSHDLIAFLLLSGLLVAVSHKPLRRPGSHGFYRYFAWQTMLVLIFLNRPEWGEHPETLHQQIAIPQAEAPLALHARAGQHPRAHIAAQKGQDVAGIDGR